ncbi:calcium-binding protein [Amaricoccus sp. W119]|uniref:calcium-binding protein n=1 Tax=Amaricoccus sp. W119 TaxID=3391833 RepID=UPI0039A74D46
MPTIITDGETYEGGPGDDIVLIRANDVTADGNGGDDRLVTQLYRQTADGVSLSTDLSGGTGHDTLTASMGFEDAPDDYDIPLSISATLDGGAGDDIIRAELTSAYADQFFTIDAGDGDDRVTVRQTLFNWVDTNDARHRSESAVRAGGGDDVISVVLREGGYTGLTDAGTGVSSTVHGSDGVDRITSDVTSYFGSDAENFLYGGDGADRIVAASASTGGDWGSGSAYNRARGGEGDDRIEMEAQSNEATATNSATGDAGNDTISVLGVTWWGAVYNDLSGGDGEDRLTARIETANEYAEEFPSTAVNTIEGGDGDDRITGVVSLGDTFDETGEFRSELYGGAGDDVISARGGFDNILAGNQGDDTLRGSGSTDRLIGGQGADVLRGGGGEDEFVFKGTRGEASERDRVADFSQGEDRFDLSAIDANVFRGGNQAFTFDGGTGTGRVWVEEAPNGNGSLLHADNGRGTLVVALSDGRAMDASDYEAGDFLL